MCKRILVAIGFIMSNTPLLLSMDGPVSPVLRNRSVSDPQHALLDSSHTHDQLNPTMRHSTKDLRRGISLKPDEGKFLLECATQQEELKRCQECIAKLESVNNVLEHSNRELASRLNIGNALCKTSAASSTAAHSLPEMTDAQPIVPIAEQPAVDIISIDKCEYRIKPGAPYETAKKRLAEIVYRTDHWSLSSPGIPLEHALMLVALDYALKYDRESEVKTQLIAHIEAINTNGHK